MASVEKFTLSAVRNQLRHNLREIAESSNKDIDRTLSHLNYSLAPDRGGLSDLGYFRLRKSELHCMKRADVKVMAGWVVTVPQELDTPEQQRAFFQAAYDFLEGRYGQKNVIQAVVHLDEGKREKALDRWGNPLLREDGSEATRLVYGRPHMHFCFIPAIKSDEPQLEKICAKKVLDRRELQRFHGDFQAYLDDHGIECKVVTGAVRAYGRNRTVAELKREYEVNKELERLRQTERRQERGRW